MKNNDEKIATTVKIPRDLYDEFKILGIRQHVSLQALVEKCMRLFVEEETFRETIASYSVSSLTVTSSFSPSSFFPLNK